MTVVVTLVAVCALFVVNAIAAGNPAEVPRVCVSSAAASVGAGGEVVQTTNAIDCG